MVLLHTTKEGIQPPVHHFCSGCDSNLSDITEIGPLSLTPPLFHYKLDFPTLSQLEQLTNVSLTLLIVRYVHISIHCFDLLLYIGIPVLRLNLALMLYNIYTTAAIHLTAIYTN